MRLWRASAVLLLIASLSIATVRADVTIRGRTVTTEAPLLPDAAAAGGGAQALAGALMAFDAEPKASISFLKPLGPSSGSLCKRSRASSSAGEISRSFVGNI